MSREYPTNVQLYTYIRDCGITTIRQICNHFGYTGPDVITVGNTLDPDLIVMAIGVDKQFFAYLQEFMKKEYVYVNDDYDLRLSIDGPLTYTGTLLNIVLSVDTGCELFSGRGYGHYIDNSVRQRHNELLTAGILLRD